MGEGEKEVQGKSHVTDQKGHGVSLENCPTASGFPPSFHFFAECLSQLTWPSLAQVQGLVCNVSEFAACPAPGPLCTLCSLHFGSGQARVWAIELANTMVTVGGPSVNSSV